MNMFTEDFFQTLPSTAVYQTIADHHAELTLSFHLVPEFSSNAIELDLAFSYTHPKKRKYFTSQDIRQLFMASDNVIQKMIGFFASSGLKVESDNIEKREVNVTGAIQQFAQLLGVSFHIYRHENGNLFLAYHGHIQLPADLRPHILNIDGLNIGLPAAHLPSEHKKFLQATDKTSPLKNFIQKREPQAQAGAEADQTIAPFKGYSPQDFSKLYSFPDNEGEGQTVGIIALGGAFQPNDLDVFCKMFNIDTPNVQIIGNEPWQDPQSKTANDREINLDTQMVSGLVPKAKIVVYLANSFQEGFQAVLDDTENKVNVVTTSWANGEQYVSSATRGQLILLLQKLSLRGITVLAASGDDRIHQIGSNYTVVGINLPAGFDHIIACGGTTLYRNGYQQVWEDGPNGSGGAFSNIYPAPAFQKNALENYFRQYPAYTRNASATPDISVNASVMNHATVIYNGKPFVIGGTSVATPIIAALIARLNTALGYQLGYINPLLYQLMGSTAFNSNIPGNNGLPSASGWDPCTGLGSPNGEVLLDFIKKLEEH